jgi:hypothetical protein
MPQSAKTSAPDTAPGVTLPTVSAGGSPLSTVLMAVATEVRDLAAAADGLQDLVGSLLTDPLAMADSSALERGQALDAVVQRLQALEMFLATLAPSVKPEWEVDPREAADRLLLASLAQKLSGVAVDIVQEDRGECDFF